MPLIRLDHLLVLTDDIDATRDFYCRALGLRVGSRPPLQFPGYWLYANDAPCVHVAQRAAYAAHARTLGLAVPDGAAGAGSIDHIAFTASGYEEIVERLREHGVPAVANSVPDIGLRQLFVTDPSGVGIEINVRPE